MITLTLEENKNAEVIHVRVTSFNDSTMERVLLTTLKDVIEEFHRFNDEVSINFVDSKSS
jgi:hypothetical protein